MLDLRKKLFIMISIGVGIIIAIILATMFFSRDPAKDSSPIQDASVEEIADVVDEPKDTVISGVPLPEDQQELFARQSARLFVERFLSYSNQNENKNITDLLSFASANMQNWMKTQGKQTDGEYEGVTTKVISSEISEITDSSAIVSIGIQQAFQTVSGSEYKTRDGRVEMIKKGNGWLVDGIYLE